MTDTFRFFQERRASIKTGKLISLQFVNYFVSFEKPYCCFYAVLDALLVERTFDKIYDIERKNLAVHF